jgi:hypothetical protein
LVLSKGTFMGFEDGFEVPSSSIVGVVLSSCSGVLVSLVNAPSSSVYIREFDAEGFDVGAKVFLEICRRRVPLLPAMGLTTTMGLMI